MREKAVIGEVITVVLECRYEVNNKVSLLVF